MYGTENSTVSISNLRLGANNSKIIKQMQKALCLQYIVVYSCLHAGKAILVIA